ncbi:GtrA family protein [Candidatus Liberibacter brunswickensis]|uniref:GtrA family protein n=1 Tax=Candidatus Liberibacter brunswickensis TaxID=1968796 RepID=UPI002FE0E708
MKQCFVFSSNIFCFFFVDVMGFILLMNCKVDPFYSRIFSIAIAFLVTWKPNRLFVFLKLRHRSFLETIRYGIIYCIASVLNYALYVQLLLTFKGLFPLLAVILSSLPSIIFVFFMYIRFVVKGGYFIKK